MNDISKFLLENYGEIAIGIIMVSFLANTVFSMWIKLAFEEEKNKNNMNIEELKSELAQYTQQLEHRHQVSQLTYQKLFDKKIEVYQRLEEVFSSYKRQLHNETTSVEATGNLDDSIFYTLYNNVLIEVIRLIEKEKLFISNELYEVYKRLQAIVDDLDIKFIEIEVSNVSINTQSEMSQYEYEVDSFNVEIYGKTKVDWEKLQEELENDILKIKIKINLD